LIDGYQRRNRSRRAYRGGKLDELGPGFNIAGNEHHAARLNRLNQFSSGLIELGAGQADE
jgi:hypothetical protein